jgi:FAD/FMN-containing dehydrogenase
MTDVVETDMVATDLIGTLRASLSAGAVLTGEDAAAAATSPWTRLGAPLAVLRPRSTDEVSTILRLAHAAGQPVTAWGGKTGLVEGCRADGALAVSLERMNRIEAIDPVAGTMTAQAGCVLQTACEAAEAEGLLLPLDLGARGSATIGGNISTNAGGNRVIRYGMMRDLVLGLEAVLADGTVVTSMNHLIKNNAGYDLKQLFIGSEGTLGIVTRAVIRLQPMPTSQNVAFLGVRSFDALPRLLRRLETQLGGALSAFEVMWDDFYQLVTTEPARGRPILADRYPYYVLVEAAGADPDEMAARFEAVLAGALEAGEADDAVIAKTGAERAQIWALRDDVGQTGRNRPIFTFDVSLGVRHMEAYVAGLRQTLAARWTAPTCVVFGHLGDGNLHVIVGVGESGPEVRHAVEEIVYRPLADIGGSISAEHGIGLQKRAFLPLSRSPVEIALMRTLKRALDPKGILNPGKIFEAA